MRKTSLVVFAMSALIVQSAWSGVTASLLKTRDAKGTPVCPGVWHAGLNETLAFAKKEGVPIVAVWSNGDGCSHCVNFEHNVMSPAFREWMAASGIVFMFAYSGDPKPDGEPQGSGATGEWCRKSKLTTFPFVRFYWEKKGKVLVDTAVIGDKVTKNKGPCVLDPKKPDPANFLFPGDKGTYNQGGRYGIYYITNGVNGVFRDWTNTPPKPLYQGGEFVTTNTVNACLQALSTTATVNVPLVREGEDETSQTLKVVGRTPGSVTVKWAAGETEKFVPIAGFNTKYFNSGKSVALQLMDESGETPVVHATTTVACLADAPDNSSTNPYWLKEKTKDTLEWGEWTMDLDAVTNKVTAWNKEHPQDRAHSLILIGGSRWCPDCVAADEYLFDRQEFKTWAQGNKVALGVVDIPNYNTVEDGPSLLSYAPSVTSDRFVTRNNSQPADETLRVMSGAGYLSRKGIGTNDAAKVIARNRDLVGRNTLEGGWKNPGRAFDAKKRTGVPQLILLRDDGTVAGRFNTFSNFGPQTWDPAYLDRLDELLAQVDADDEEDNDYVRSTKAAVATRGTKEASLSHADLADYYRIPADARNQRLGFQLEGDSAAKVNFAIVDVSGATETVVVQATTNINAAAVVETVIPSTNCYLRLSVPCDSYGNPTEAFACTSGVSTVANYRVTGNIVLEPQETEHEWTVPDDNLSVMVSVRKGVTYRMVGLDDENASVQLAFRLLDGERKLYECIADTGVVGVSLKAKTFVYQIWKTGEIGFGQKKMSVSEKAGSFVFKVKRSGGTAGAAAATISLDTARSTKLSGIWDREAWYADYEGKELTWDEGDAAKEYSFRIGLVDNDFADDAQQLVFKLAKSGGYAPVGGDALSAELVVTISNDDKPAPGKVGITGCAGGFSKSMSVVAKGSSQIELEIQRYSGADGAASVSIAGTRCELSDASFAWATREAGEAFKKTLLVTLPPYSAKCKTASVKLTSSRGAKVDTQKRTVSITLIPEEAPEFNLPVGSASCFRYTAIPSGTGVDVVGEGALKVKKLSGSLPTGITWKLDGKRLVFSGTPTQARTFVAVFQVSCGSVAGGTYQMTFNVADPAVKTSDPEAPYNPNVVKSRTISDILDIDDRDGGSLYGLMTLTINRTGKLSAKNRTIEGTYSFASKGWREVLPDGTMVADLVCTSKSSPDYGEKMLTVKVPPDDRPVTIESSMGFAGVPQTWDKVGAPPADWAGTYTVNLHDIRAVEPIDGTPIQPFCKGDGYMTLKMTSTLAKKQGKVTYAAVLPNGKAVSGTATLAPHFMGEEKTCAFASLPLLVASSADDLTAVLRIVRNAKAVREEERCSVHSIYQPYWQHRESGVVTASYEALFDAYGTVYDGSDADDFIACCEEKFKTTTLAFFVDTARLASEKGGKADAWTTNDVTVTVSKDKNDRPTITLDNPQNAASLKLTFARDTGLVSGSFKVKFADGVFRSLTYKGIVLPGFGTASCSDCGLLSGDSLKAPFVGGSAWFNDTVGYEDARGREKSKSVRRGCAVSIGLEMGK